MRIIDPHVHVYKNDPAYPWAPETRTPPREDATPEMLLGLMEANGVVRNEMKSLSEEDKEWLFCKSVLRLWPFK